MQVFNKGKRVFTVEDGGQVKRLVPNRFTELSDDVAKSILAGYPRELSKTEETKTKADNSKLLAENKALKDELEEIKKANKAKTQKIQKSEKSEKGKKDKQ